jgi:hypothetical protein
MPDAPGTNQGSRTRASVQVDFPIPVTLCKNQRFWIRNDGLLFLDLKEHLDRAIQCARKFKGKQRRWNKDAILDRVNCLATNANGLCQRALRESEPLTLDLEDIGKTITHERHATPAWQS